MLGWNEFGFFAETPLGDPSGQLFADPDVLDVSTGSNDSVFFSTRSGTVKAFDASFTPLLVFTACGPSKSVEFVRAIENTSFVMTVAFELGQPLEVSIWDVENVAAADESYVPPLHTRFSVSAGSNMFPVTCLEFQADLSVLVFGFAGGDVVVVRGDPLRDRGTRCRSVYKAPTAVTHLLLSRSGDEVLVASLTQIVVVSTTSVANSRVLDKTHGAELLCAANARLTSEMLVARTSELVFFNWRHRGRAFELDVAKRRVFLTSSNTYLVVVAAFPQKNQLLEGERRRLLVLDLQSHLIAYSRALTCDIRSIFELNDQINVWLTDGTMLVLSEKPLLERVGLLQQRGLFQTAIQLAEANGSSELVLQLHQSFAEYLYSKHDVEGALREYSLAVDLNQTSRAISSFKDSQHAPQLLSYLQVLFRKGKSTKQHLTLQCICYVKLGLYDELEAFLRECVSKASNGDVDIDWEQLVDVLTETQTPRGYMLAAYVAENWPDPDLVVGILLRLLGNAQQALDYIQTVSVADALRLLIQNSTLLLNKLPVETTGVLITLFTGRFVSKERASDSNTSANGEASANGSTDTNLPVLQSYQAFIKYISSKSYLGSHILSAETLQNQPKEPSYLPPRPRLIFPAFINHDNEFVIFLEACLECAPNFHCPEKDLQDLATVLFETYIRAGMQQQARDLIKQHGDVLNHTRVRVVAEMHKFPLSAEQELALGTTPPDVFRKLCSSENYKEALEFLFKHADESPDMAVQAVRTLSFDSKAVEFLRKTDTESNNGQGSTLKLVCDAALSAGFSEVPLVELVSSSPHLTVGDVAPFVTSIVERSRLAAERHRKLAQSYMAELGEKQKKLEKLEKEPHIAKYDECSECGQPVELPAVHFRCGHSYHQHCLTRADSCTRCLATNEVADELAEQRRLSAEQEQYFLDELVSKPPQDRMRVVMDFISRGALSKIN